MLQGVPEKWWSDIVKCPIESQYLKTQISFSPDALAAQSTVDTCNISSKGKGKEARA